MNIPKHKKVYATRYEVYEGSILRASQHTKKLAGKYLKPGRTIKKVKIRIS